jgi:hypothetical protein
MNAIPTFSTVRQFTAKHQAFKIGGVRWLIFNEISNGLKEAGAVVRVGRKVLINEELFFAWIQQGGAR